MNFCCVFQHYDLAGGKLAPLLSLFVIVSLSGGCASSVNTVPLASPQGFASSVGTPKQDDFSCRYYPPHTGNMDFPGKISDASEDQADYKAAATNIYSYTRYLFSLSERMRNNLASSKQVQCYYDLLTAWAQDGAMLQPGKISKTGKAVRKWTLASLSSNYLKVSGDLDSTVESEKRRLIESWLRTLAYLVKNDYAERPLYLVNYHDYWAAWAVVVTAVTVNDRYLFNWAADKYKTAISQINSKGLLPNELKDSQRAVEQHNQALLALTSTRAFLHANQYPLDRKADESLSRLVYNVQQAVYDPSIFASEAGAEQRGYTLTTDGRLLWIVPFITVIGSDLSLQQLINDVQLADQTNARLGGKMCALYPGVC